jgi:hypothetical protein
MAVPPRTPVRRGRRSARSITSLSHQREVGYHSAMKAAARLTTEETGGAQASPLLPSRCDHEVIGYRHGLRAWEVRRAMALTPRKLTLAQEIESATTISPSCGSTANSTRS